MSSSSTDKAITDALAGAVSPRAVGGAAAQDGPVAKAAAKRGWLGLRSADWLCFMALCAVTFALWAPRLTGPIDLRTDAAVYYVTGTAIAEGRGYVLSNEPGDIHAVQYPPLLPGFVAAHRLVVGTSDPQVLGRALRVSYLLISLAYAVSVYAMARSLLVPSFAFVVGLVTSLFLQTYFLSNSLFAEIPFALLTMLFIIASRRSNRPGWFALSSLLAIAAYLVRTAGIALLAAWIGEALLRRQWKQLFARLVVAAVPFFGWQAYVNSVTSSPEYTQPAYEYQRAPYQYYNVPYADNVALIDPFQPEQGRITTSAVARRFLENLTRIPVTMGHCVSTVPGYFEWTLRDAHNWFGVPKLPIRLAEVPPTLLGLLVTGGFVLLALRHEWLLCLYAGATIGLVCLTPWPVQFTRYLTPLTPILALAMMMFLAQVTRWLSGGGTTPRAARSARITGGALIAMVVGLILAMQSYSLARAYRSGWILVPADLTRIGGGRLFFFDEKWVAYAEAVDWLRTRAEAGDVVATASPQWVYVAGGFKTVMPPMEIDPQEAQRLLDTVPVRYAIVDDQDVGSIVSRYLAPAIEAHPQHWRLIHETSVAREDDTDLPPARARIYERVR